MEQLIQVITEAATALVASGLVAVVGFVLGLLKMKLTEGQRERLKQAAILAVGFAEERARQAAKAGVEKLTGAMIEKIAIDALLDRIPNIDRDEARKIILSVLPYARSGMNAGAETLGNALATPEAESTPVQ